MDTPHAAAAEAVWCGVCADEDMLDMFLTEKARRGGELPPREAHAELEVSGLRRAASASASASASLLLLLLLLLQARKAVG
jgi:hypothetical protein